MNRKKRSLLRTFVSLTKITVMFPVALTAATGYFVFNATLSSGLYKVVSGVLMMAIAASVLNQLQEKLTDARMERTQNRPLASRELPEYLAWILLVLFTGTGAWLLYSGGGIDATIIGFVTMIWYNGVYTNLKKITAFAVVPGALTGALPPLIGFIGAGGVNVTPDITALCFVFFMAQIPHFWLIQIRYGDQYAKAGFPALTKVLTRSSIERLTFAWVVASLVSTLLLPMFGLIREASLLYLLFILTGIVFLLFLNRMLNTITLKEKVYFIIYNIYFLGVMILVTADKFI